MTTSAGRRVVAALVAAGVLTGVAACAGGGGATEPSAASRGPGPPLRLEVVQLRRDQVLQRVEVAVTNTGRQPLVVDRLRLDVSGFRLPGWLDKGEPLPAGQVVDLPVPFSGVDCTAAGTAEVGRPVVTLQVRVGSDPTTRAVRQRAQDTSGLLARIAGRACAVARVRRDVDLRFADRWRLTRTAQGKSLHGELLAHLRPGSAPRTITQVAGAIMYGLRPDTTSSATPTVLAALSRDRPDARIPVVAFAARCDGHTIGEIKKPYEFLVWVGDPSGQQLAVTPDVGSGTRTALRQVCAF